MPPNISSPGVHRAQYIPFNAAKVVKGLSLANIRNEKQDPFRCGMSGVSGADHRNALGLAMSKAQDVMTRASGTSAEQKACIEKTVGWLNSAGAGGIGNIVLQRLTALGASHSAVADLLKDTPRDDNLRSLEAQVNKMIVDLGIAIGECRTPPQGTALNTLEKAVAKLNDKADLCVKSCASSVGGQKFMEAIGRAILPQPIMNALVEKRPDLIGKISKDGAASVDLMEVLNAKALRSVQNVVNVELDTSDAQAAVTAVIQLLKIPEFVVERDPGKEGPQPNKEKGVSDLPPGVRELAGDGKNVAVNYNDFGKMGNKSKVDGANAARLAELDVEKHRITIEGMLQAFKLGLQGSHGCGHLITGIRNAGGHIGTPADDPRHATRTRSIEIQADLVDNQPNGESSNREIHTGSITLLTGDEERLGVVPPGPDPFTASLDTGANAIAEVESFWMNDDSLDYLSLTDPSIERASQNHNAGSPDVEVQHEVQKPVADDVDLLTEFETLEPRWNALRSRGSEQEDVRQMHTSVDDLPHTRNIASAQIQKNEDTVATQSLIASNTQVRQTTTNDLNELESADVTRPPDYVPSRTVQPRGSVITPEREFKLYVDARNKEKSDRLMLDTESGGDVEDFSRWRGKPMGAGSTAGSVLVQDMKAFFRNEALDASAKLIQPSVARGRGFVNAEPVVVEGSMMKRSSGRQERRAEDANVVSAFQKLMSLRKEGAQVSVALSQSGAGKAFGGLAQAKAQAARIERLMQADQPVHADFPVISQEELTRNLLHVPDLVALSDRTLGPDGKDLQARLDAMRLKLDEMEAEVDQSLAPVLSEAQSSSEDRELAPAPKHSVAAMTDDLLSEIRNAKQKLRQGHRVWRDSLGQGWRDTRSVQ